MCFDGCFALCQRLQSNDPTLTVLNLNHAEMGNDGAKALAAALLHNHTVVVLFLQHNGLGSSGMQALADALQHHPTLQHLYLDDNHLGDAGCKALAQLLRHGTSLSLRVLKVADNGIGPAGAAVLAQALPHSQLEYLCLQKNSLGLPGMRALQQALSQKSSSSSSSSSTLRWLDVRCNQVTTAYYQQVLDGWTHVLEHYNETLCVLELWERNELETAVPCNANAKLEFWLQWNRAGRRSLKQTQGSPIPMKRLLANAAAASPDVIWATLQARPDLVVMGQQETS